MSKRLGGSIGYKDQTSSWHLICWSSSKICTVVLCVGCQPHRELLDTTVANPARGLLNFYVTNGGMNINKQINKYPVQLTTSRIGLATTIPTIPVDLIHALLIIVVLTVHKYIYIYINTTYI